MTDIVDKDLEGKKVIILEDDPLLYTLISKKLTDLQARGVEVQTRTQAEEALATAKAIKPDLIVLDLVLPGMNGFEFLAALRADENLKATEVIIVSNLSSDEDLVKAKALGVKHFYVKADMSLDKIDEEIVSALKGSN